MLDDLRIEDTQKNAEHRFVRAELTPPMDIFEPVNEWKFNVDQDDRPKWFVRDYEKQRMIDGVKQYLDDNVFFDETDNKKLASELQVKDRVVLGGMAWSVFKKGEEGSAYLLIDQPIREMAFGSDNKYKTSYIRKYLLSGELSKRIKAQYADKCFVKIFKDDTIGLMDSETYRKNRGDIKPYDSWWWLSDPYPGMARCVQCVRSCCGVDYDLCRHENGVRPFCILKSDNLISLI